MAAEPNTRCGNCGSPLDPRGYCPVCTGQATQQFTPSDATAPRSPVPPAPAAAQGPSPGFGQTAGPELTGRVCPYCRFPLKEGVAIETCGSCGAVHHVECWQDNSGCSVTGCVNGPANTTATHVAPPAAAPATTPAAYAAPPPPPSKPPPPPTNNRSPTGAVVAAAAVVALLGAGAALAISSSSKNHTTPTVVTVKERTVEKQAPAASTPTPTAHTPSTTHTSTPATPPAAQAGPSSSEREAHSVAAVDSYWGDIENHDYSGAYQIEEPSAGSSESEWVQAEEKEGVEHVSYSFEPGSLEGNEATVNISSLQTVARKTGCYTWTGYYRLTDYSGTWKITHDGLERHSC